MKERGSYGVCSWASVSEKAVCGQRSTTESPVSKQDQGMNIINYSHLHFVDTIIERATLKRYIIGTSNMPKRLVVARSRVLIYHLVPSDGNKAYIPPTSAKHETIEPNRII